MMKYKPISLPKGEKLHCKNWQIEAPYRMIQHNVQEDVAEIPEELIVYGGTGKAARNWDCFYAILN
ncbi:MAG: urocanate hydratase, partial [Candidatus Cloacimonadia bacterium]